MKTRLFFARAMALALVAGGIVASVPTEAMAVTRTWTNGSTSLSGNRTKWGTTAQFATNWSGVANPTASDNAQFLGNAGSTFTVNVQSNNTPVGKITIGGTTAYTFQAQSFGNSLLISGTGVPKSGIENTSNKVQTFAAVTIGGSGQTVNATSGSGGSLAFTSLNLQNNYFAVAGDASVTGLTGASGSTYEAKSGNQTIVFAEANSVGTLKVSGGTTTSSGDSGRALLDVSGGTYTGGGTFDKANVSSGLLDLTGQSVLNLGATSGASFIQGGGGVTMMSVGFDTDTAFSYVHTNAGAGFTLGGSLVLDGTQMPSTPMGIGLTWNLFQGDNFTSGSASPLNNASNFSALALQNGSSPYNGTFTQYGQEWISPAATDGTYLVFQAATGNLVVVPEPSTIVFAGLGVAMSGWTMWKKRRLSKLLAAKAG